MKIYARLEGRDTWHFHPRCRHLRESKRPRAIKATKPRSGEFCDECLAKTRAGQRAAKAAGRSLWRRPMAKRGK